MGAVESSKSISALDLLDRDHHSQELLKCLKRTNFRKKITGDGCDAPADLGLSLPAKASFHRAYSLTSVSGSSSFMKAADTFKRSVSSTVASISNRGFVFTSTKDQEGEAEEENQVPNNPRKVGEKQNRQSWPGNKRAAKPPKRAKKKKDTTLFDELAKYQCEKVTQ